MRKLVPLVAVLAVQPLVVVLPTVADAFTPAARPVAPKVTRLALHGVDRAALAAERTAGRPLTQGVEVDPSAPAVRGPQSPVGAGSLTLAAPSRPATVADELEVAALSRRTATRSFTVAGVTWTGATPSGTTVALRVREHGRWGPWTPLPTSDDGPDAGTAEAAGARSGTEPLLTGGDANGVQVKVLSDTGAVPGGLGVTLVDPGDSPADGVVGTTGTASAQAAGARPRIITRRQWGADESLRKGDPVYLSRVRAGVLHHTAGSNSYSAASVPAQLRGIYAYHTRGRGWNDIGYNLLVDRFGRVWEGRAGGVDRAVQGAHTLGFNSQTFGVSAMGNYETASPSSAMRRAIVRIFAWKFSHHRINPRGSARLTSQGSPRFREGAKVRVRTMAAHRELGWTACPGRNLYTRMSSLRRQVATRVGAEILVPRVRPRVVVHDSGDTVDVSAQFTLKQSWKVTVTGACKAKPYWRRTGTGRSVAVSWPLTKQSGKPIAPGAYTVRLTSWTSSSTATPYSVRVEVLPGSRSALGPCPAVRLASTSASSVADGTRRFAGASRTLVVVPTRASARAESVGAGALAHALGARLMSSPGGRLSSAVLARIDRDHVTEVVLVGRDGTWSGGVAGQLSGTGASLSTVGGNSRVAVLANSARRAAAARSTHTAVLVDAGDIVPAAAAAAAAAAKGAVVLPMLPSRVPATTSSALSDLGITDVVLAGRGGIPASAKTALAAEYDLVDRRSSTRDGALTAMSTWLPRSRWDRVVAVAATGSDGLEAILASALARPMLLIDRGALARRSASALAARRASVGRIGVAATRALASAKFLAALHRRAAKGHSAAARRPVGEAHAPAVNARLPLVAASAPDSFTVKGSGFGHGAGMSQYGAYALAKDGQTWSKILAKYYPGTRKDRISDHRRITVNLLHQTRRATFSVVPAPWVDADRGSMRLNTARGRITMGVGERATVIPGPGGGIQVWQNGRKVLSTRGRVHVIWTGTGDWRRKPAAVGRVSGSGSTGSKADRSYRYGEIWVHRVGSRLEVVGEMGLGQYLRGIAEMPASWGVTGAHALRAQAVAARTYAWRKMRSGLRSSCKCHVYDSTLDQAFRGYETETGYYGRFWRSAVRHTEGRVLTYAGRPAEALYYSSSGGRTQDVRDVFGGSVPYLVSVADPYSLDPAVHNPYAAWTRTISQKKMRSAFHTRYTVVSVTVVSRTSGRAAARVRARLSNGDRRTISGSTFRSRLHLPATWVWSVRGS